MHSFEIKGFVLNGEMPRLIANLKTIISPTQYYGGFFDTDADGRSDLMKKEVMGCKFAADCLEALVQAVNHVSRLGL